MTREVESAVPAPPPATESAAPAFNPRDLMALYLAGRFDELSERFLGILTYLQKTPHHLLARRQDQYFVNAFVKIFLHLFTQPDYIIGDAHIVPFLRQNLTISNLVAVSSFRTTDAHLALLADQQANFVKTLTLYSARNLLKFDRRKFFDLDAVQASIWYCAYGQIFRSGLVSEVVCRNLREHYEFHDERFNLNYEPQEVFFGSTYVDGECDRLVKPHVNQTMKRLAAGYPIRNVPNPRKIAVLSGVWSPGHSVYRISSQYVAALREKYHLTYFQLGGFGFNIDARLFDDVRQIKDGPGGIDISSLLDNDFQVAYFPDVGMTHYSIVLANMRLAPIQIATSGHSVSTWGADVDYFISGADVELPENPERNFSERLVLLPGFGAIHNWPLYEQAGQGKSAEAESAGGKSAGAKSRAARSSDEIIVNCPWFAQKVNYRFCKLLQRLVSESEKKLRLRVFVGASLARQFDYLPFVRELGAALAGAELEVIVNRPYQDYMELMEEGDLALDSFHFGGCNTIADSLFLRKPTVAYEGDKWYSRIGPQMLRTVGLPELIATNDDEYVRIASRLIRDVAYRRKIGKRLAAADLAATVFAASDAVYFREAIDFLIANHDRLKTDPDRSPIRIG